MEKLLFTTGWASWSSIFAGSITALAISILFTVFGMALGFAVVKPKSDDPASGLGVAFGGWSFLSVVVSMAAGGYIAGLFASQRGVAHGFIVWAVVTIVACCFSGIALGSVLKSLGIAIKTIGQGIGHGAAGAVSAAGGAVSAAGKGGAHIIPDAIADLRENINSAFDPDKMQDNIVGVLRDTGVEELQPERLQQQMYEVRADLRALLRQLAIRPTEYENIIMDFLAKEKNRFDEVTDNLDKDTAVQALMKSRNIPEEEARAMVNNAIQGYNQAISKARRSFDDARRQVEEMKAQIEIMTVRAREKADRFASSAAKVAMVAGIAMIVAAAISMGAGWCGAEHSRAWLTLQGASIIG